MFAEALTESKESGNASSFPATRWSLVLGVQTDKTQTSEQAMADLCQIYWYPIYAYARKCGQTPQNAEDLTQSFFAHLIETEFFRSADAQVGRLRSFLLGAFKRFARDRWRAAQQQKRGGHLIIESIDREDGERKYQDHLLDQMTPELAYDQLWVMSLLERVAGALESECRERGKGELFLMVKPFLFHQGADLDPYDEAAEKLGLTVAGVRTAVHRIRKRYRELLIDHIRDTLTSNDDLTEEVNYLMGIFQHGSSA